MRDKSTFYASPYGGKRYHSNPQCNGLNTARMASPFTGVPRVSRIDIVGRGLTPCKVCMPSPMLWVAS